MQILKETDIDWRERRLMSKVYLDGGYAVAKLVVALRYKPEGRMFDSSQWPRTPQEIMT
jgi:hypothetical protein